MQHSMHPFKLAAATISLLILAVTPKVMALSSNHLGYPPAANVTTIIGRKLETGLIFSAGYRRDDLDWNIAGDSSGNTLMFFHTMLVHVSIAPSAHE